MIDNKKEYKTEHKFWLRNLRKVNNKKGQLTGGRDGVEVWIGSCQDVRMLWSLIFKANLFLLVLHSLVVNSIRLPHNLRDWFWINQCEAGLGGDVSILPCFYLQEHIVMLAGFIICSIRMESKLLSYQCSRKSYQSAWTTTDLLR